MTTFYALFLLLCGIIIVQAAVSIMHSRQIFKLTKEMYQLHAKIQLLETEASNNDEH